MGLVMKDLQFFEGFNFADLELRLRKIVPARSYISDLTLAVTNLISILEHFAFTGAKTQKPAYYDLSQNVQSMVARLFKILQVPSELEPIARDLLAASMRFMEVGTKQLSLNERQLAQDFFQKAYQLQLLFYGLAKRLLSPEALQPLIVADFTALRHYLEQFNLPADLPKENTPKTESAKIAKDLPFKDLNDFIEKVDALKKQNRLDLSSDQDLTLGIMNLVNLEEEFFLLGAEHNYREFYDVLLRVREMRKTFLQAIVQRYEGEVWCISKHLMAASMRCLQSGVKLLDAQQKPWAYEMFKFSYDLYSLFWGLNLGILNQQNSDPKPKGFLGTLGFLVKKAIDCCIE